MQAVIFDMDGVLFDTERLAVRAWDKIGEDIGLGKVGYMVFKTLGRTTKESVKIFKNEFGERFDNTVFQRHYREYLDEYYRTHDMPIKTGVAEILTFLKEQGYPAAVASSSSRESVMHHLNKAGITEYFNAVICGDMIEKSKPEPDIYLEACRALRLEAKKCFAVEDSKSGLLSAHRAGCKVVFIPDIYIPDDEAKSAVNLVFNDLNEFRKYLEKN